MVKFTVARLTMALAFLLLAGSVAAQEYKPPQARKVPRIGVLLGPASGPASPFANAVRDGLRERGYVEGQNIAIEWRGVGVKGHAELADELVRLNVDVIVAGNNLQIEAARRATSTIPIVMAIALDPIHSGFVANLARPGGNITGLSLQFPEVARKRVQFLKETVPSFSRIAVLWDPALTGIQSSVRESELAARALGARVQILEARSPGELDSAFATMTREGAQAVVIWGSELLQVHRTRIAELATRSRLPTMCPFREYVEAGCLMSYAPHVPDLFRRAAYFVDKILKGAKPADLPVEQPTKFELVVNLKTAKALGLRIPQSVLLQTDQVIE